MQFFRGHTDIFQSSKKWFFTCPIATKFSPVIGYGLKSDENIVLIKIDIIITKINKKLCN